MIALFIMIAPVSADPFLGLVPYDGEVPVGSAQVSFDDNWETAVPISECDDKAVGCTWTDEDGNEQTRLGVRYSELLAFIISAI